MFLEGDKAMEIHKVEMVSHAMVSVVIHELQVESEGMNKSRERRRRRKKEGGGRGRGREREMYLYWLWVWVDRIIVPLSFILLE